MRWLFADAGVDVGLFVEPLPGSNEQGTTALHPNVDFRSVFLKKTKKIRRAVSLFVGPGKREVTGVYVAS